MSQSGIYMQHSQMSHPCAGAANEIQASYTYPGYCRSTVTVRLEKPAAGIHTTENEALVKSTGPSLSENPSLVAKHRTK